MAASPASAGTGGQIGKPLHVLVDTNVVLDILLGRQPWASQAKAMWDARDAGALTINLPASVLTDIFYITRKQAGLSRAKQAVAECLARFTVLSVDHALLTSALSMSGPDFEDNVQIACAQAAGLDLIVTRDPAGFAHAGMPAIAPPDITRYLP